MEELKITKGKWSVDPLNQISIIDDSNNILDQLIAQTNGKSREERTANSKLIAEAGTIANQTGRTPSQLLEERNGLLEVLEELVEVLSDPDYKIDSFTLQPAEKAIEKVKATK